MRLSHVNITMPAGGEDAARAFYGLLLGMKEIPKPETMRARGGVWFEAGTAGLDAVLDVHVSVDDRAGTADGQRHFGLECDDVEAIRERLAKAGVAIDPGRPAPWKRFFVHDPFGNRIEVHQRGGLRG